MNIPAYVLSDWYQNCNLAFTACMFLLVLISPKEGE